MIHVWFVLSKAIPVTSGSILKTNHEILHFDRLQRPVQSNTAALVFWFAQRQKSPECSMHPLQILKCMIRCTADHWLDWPRWLNGLCDFREMGFPITSDEPWGKHDQHHLKMASHDIGFASIELVNARNRRAKVPQFRLYRVVSVFVVRVRQRLVRARQIAAESWSENSRNNRQF